MTKASIIVASLKASTKVFAWLSDKLQARREAKKLAAYKQLRTEQTMRKWEVDRLNADLRDQVGRVRYDPGIVHDPEARPNPTTRIDITDKVVRQRAISHGHS